jgi:hypothetical protein
MAPQNDAQNSGHHEATADSGHPKTLVGQKQEDHSAAAQASTWWQAALAMEEKERRQQPWTSTVDKNGMDYNKTNYYTTPKGIMSYDETTN